MKKIVASWPNMPRTKESQSVAFCYAMILVLITTAQLFSFEKFIPLLETFDFPGDDTGRWVAVMLVVCGVFALPFLLRMKLSHAMRWCSMVAGWIVPAVWFAASLWANIMHVSVANAGYLGSSVQLLPGWWTVFIAAALGLLAAWSSWGLWPGHRAALLERTAKK